MLPLEPGLSVLERNARGYEGIRKGCVALVAVLTSIQQRSIFIIWGTKSSELVGCYT